MGATGHWITNDSQGLANIETQISDGGKQKWWLPTCLPVFDSGKTLESPSVITSRQVAH